MIGELMNSLFVPIMILSGVIGLMVMGRIASKNYIKVPPNKVAIFYGRKHKVDGREVGFRVVSGGAKLKLPVVEDLMWLDLNMFSIDLFVKNAPNKDGVLVSVKGVANVKILSDQASLMAAAERFLGMQPMQIQGIAHKNLEGHLRAIIGKLSVEEIVTDRGKLNQTVLSEAGEDLKKMGLSVDVLTIQEVEDEHEYIKSLGEKRTAEVKRDAEIGSAEAKRQATMQATTANQEAEVKKQENLALEAEAVKKLTVKQAEYRAETLAAEAKAEQAGLLATAEAKKAVVEKEIAVAVAEAERREKELLREKVRPAEAEKASAIAQAEGDRQKNILAAEAEKQKKVLEGEGKAAAIRAEGQAEADAIRAKLVAEAEGILKKAEAYEKLNQSGQILQILEAAQQLVPNALKEFAGVMQAAASPLGHADKIVVIDSGGANGNGSAIERYANIGPQMIFGMLEKAKAMGFDLEGMLRQVESTMKPAKQIDNGNSLPPAE